MVELVAWLEDRNPGVDFWVTKRGDLLKLTYLTGDDVDPFMRDLAAAAEELGKTVAVDATREMEGFYAGHGFVKNAGRHADEDIDERMYRPPDAA